MLSFVVPSRAFSGFECADASAEDLSPFSKGTESGGTTEGCLNLGLETEAGSAVCDSGWEHPVYPAMLPPFCFVSCQEKLLKPVCWQSSSRAKQSKIGAALGAGPATGPNPVLLPFLVCKRNRPEPLGRARWLQWCPAPARK